MELPGVLKKKAIGQGLIKNNLVFQEKGMGDQEKIMWNFYRGLGFRS